MKWQKSIKWLQWIELTLVNILPFLFKNAWIKVNILTNRLDFSNATGLLCDHGFTYEPDLSWKGLSWTHSSENWHHGRWSIQPLLRWEKKIPKALNTCRQNCFSFLQNRRRQIIMIPTHSNNIMHGVLTNLKFLRKKIVYLFAKQVFIISLLASPNHTNWKKRKKKYEIVW